MLLCRRVILLHRGMGEVSRPCPALLFASLLLSYHVFLALTSTFFSEKNYFFWETANPSVTLRVPAPLSGEPF